MAVALDRETSGAHPHDKEWSWEHSLPRGSCCCSSDVLLDSPLQRLFERSCVEARFIEVVKSLEAMIGIFPNALFRDVARADNNKARSVAVRGRTDLFELAQKLCGPIPLLIEAEH